MAKILEKMNSVLGWRAYILGYFMKGKIALKMVLHACVSNSLQPHGQSWNLPGKNTRADCHFLFHSIFLTQELNLHLLHWQAERWLYHQEKHESGTLVNVCFPAKLDYLAKCLMCWWSRDFDYDIWYRIYLLIFHSFSMHWASCGYKAWVRHWRIMDK